MKIISDAREVVTNKSFSNKATIKPSAAMFQALYSDTYSDKIGSCIRETVSNSIDSHKKSNNPNPVQITLPSALTPYFRVKDNGTGIPHHTFHSLWLGYFNTTKDEDETAIGGYGVGCKSPSAYTDQYDVINIHDGVLVHHKIILDEDGIPSADIIRTHKTSEPSGIEVIIPVKDCDIDEFVQKTARQICFFHPYPEVTGNASFNPVSYYSEEPYYFKKTTGHRLTLNVGGVGFSLSTNLIKSVISENVFDDYDFLVSYANYRDKTLIINTGVNEVKPSLSRESLSFNKQTVGYLNTRLVEISTELKKKVLHMLEGINSWPQIHKLPFDDLMFLNHMSKGAKLTFTDVDGNEQRIDKPLSFGSSCYDVFWFRDGKVKSSFKKIGVGTVLMTKINILEVTNRRDINFYRKHVIEQNTNATHRDLYLVTNSEKETSGLVNRLILEGVEYSLTKKTDLIEQGIVPPKKASRAKQVKEIKPKQAGFYVVITKATSGATSSNRVKMTRTEMDDVEADFLHDGSYSDVNLVKQFSKVLNNNITIINVPARMMSSVSKTTGMNNLSIDSLTEKYKTEIEDLYQKVKYHHVMYDNLFIATTNEKTITYGKVGSLVSKKFDPSTLKSVFSVYGVSHICDDAFNLIETMSPLIRKIKLSDIKLDIEVSGKTQRFDSYLIKSNPCLNIVKKMCSDRMETELGFTCETMKDVKAAIKLIEKTTASIVDNLPMVADGAMVKSVAKSMDKDSVVSYIKLCANDIRDDVIASLN